VAGVHAMAESIGGFYDTQHGVANAIYLPVVMDFNAIAMPAKFAEIARCMGEAIDCLAPMAAARRAAEAVRQLAADLAFRPRARSASETRTFRSSPGVRLANLAAPDNRELLERLSTWSCSCGTAGMTRESLRERGQSDGRGLTPACELLSVDQAMRQPRRRADVDSSHENGRRLQRRDDPDELTDDLVAGSADAAKKAKIPPCRRRTTSTSSRCSAARRASGASSVATRPWSPRRLDQLCLLGAALLGGRLPLSREQAFRTFERAFCFDTMEVGHTDYRSNRPSRS